jgi:hypothetical protein
LDLILKSWSGDAVRIDRKSAPPVVLDRPALTLGLAVQPEVLSGLAAKPGFRGRGLLGRFLFLLPESRLGRRSVATKPVPSHLAGAYEAGLRRLLDLEPDRDERGQTRPTLIRLSPEAQEAWLEFASMVERGLEEGGTFEFVRDWAGKLPGNVARLAGLFHVIQAGPEGLSRAIAQENMEAALEVGAVLVEHGLAAFDLIGADPALEAARFVWRWVEREAREAFSVREVFNALRGRYRTVAEVEPGLACLVERGYLRELPRPEGQPGRPSRTFEVNPEARHGLA